MHDEANDPPNRKEALLDAAGLIERLVYVPESGYFFWREPKGQARTDQAAGKVAADGYRRISIENNVYSAHRLAWLATYGTWPSGPIDHANGRNDDNRICNLRSCSVMENSWNQKKRTGTKSGLKGVTVSKNGRKFYANIAADGQRQFLGSFSSPDDAHQAYRDASQRLHGEFSCGGERA